MKIKRVCIPQVDSSVLSYEMSLDWSRVHLSYLVQNKWAMKRDTAGGTSAAKSAAKWSCSIHQFPLLSGLNALEAYGTAVSIDAQLSPSSSANATM